MEGLDSLSTVAEVGAALAGFAMLAGILRRDQTDRSAALGVVETSLIAVGFSLLPPLIGSLRVSAALLVVVWAAAGVSAALRQRKGTGRIAFEVSPWFNVVGWIVVLGAFGLGLLVAVGVFPEWAPRFYTSAVHCVLLQSGLLLWLGVKRTVFPAEDLPPA